MVATCRAVGLSRSALFGFAAIVVLGICSQSANAGIVSGELKSISADSQRIVILTGAAKTSKTYKLTKQSAILLNDKKAGIDQLSAGMKVSLFTTKTGEVTKVVARAATDADASATDTDGEKTSNEKEDDPSAKGNADDEKKTTSNKTTRKTAKKSKVDIDEALSTEWNQFRGPRRDNFSTETGFLKQWPDGGPAPVWGTEGLGEGYSSVSLSDDLIYTMGTKEGGEYVIAMNVDDGKILWGTKTGSVFQDGQGNGPRSTPTIDGDNVYALGAQGDLVCLDKKSGAINWQKNILQEYQANNISWGICESVLIDGKKLICTPGGRGATMVAIDKLSGDTIWASEVPTNPPASYASAIVAEVGGVRQYINFTHAGVMGVRAEDGVFLWGNQASANGTANCSAPLFYDDYVFSSSGYGTGGALVQLRSANDRTTADQKYHTNEMANHHGGMVIVDGYLYGSHDPGILTCMDVKSGKIKWKDRSVGKGSVLFADGHIYLRSENGPLALVEANPEKYVEKGRFEQPHRSDRPAWAYHVVTKGKLYLRDLDKLLCYDISEGK